MGSFGSDCSGLEGLKMCACACISAACSVKIHAFCQLIYGDDFVYLFMISTDTLRLHIIFLLTVISIRPRLFISLTQKSCIVGLLKYETGWQCGNSFILIVFWCCVYIYFFYFIFLHNICLIILYRFCIFQNCILNSICVFIHWLPKLTLQFVVQTSSCLPVGFCWVVDEEKWLCHWLHINTLGFNCTLDTLVSVLGVTEEHKKGEVRTALKNRWSVLF